MATAAGFQPSIGGVTSTIWKGSLVLSSKSRPYYHVNPTPGGTLVFTGVRVEILDAEDNIVIPSATVVDIEWNFTRFDTDDYWNVSTPEVITIPADNGGVFQICFGGVVQSTDILAQQLIVWVEDQDGNVWLLDQTAEIVNLDTYGFGASTMLELEDGATLKLRAAASTTDGLSILTGHLYSPYMTIGRWK